VRARERYDRERRSQFVSSCSPRKKNFCFLSFLFFYFLFKITDTHAERTRGMGDKDMKERTQGFGIIKKVIRENKEIKAREEPEGERA